MVEMWLPYGNTEAVVRIPDENLLGTIEPVAPSIASDAEAELRRALGSPIGSSALDSLASPNDKVAIVVDDATRRAPSTMMLKEILAVLTKSGVKEQNVTVIVGVGAHRPATSDELTQIASSFDGRIRVISHDCNAKDLLHLGETSRGTTIDLNKDFVEADLKILTGDIELHHCAGYGGGRKSILPAIAGMRSAQQNHALLLDPRARSGVLKGNPISEDMDEAAGLASPDFILNTVLDGKGRIIKAFAGNFQKAFLEGVALVDKTWKVPMQTKADVVIVSAGGKPQDLSLYQSCKALHNSLSALKEGGAVILVAECREGHGNEVFYDWMSRFREADEMEKEIKSRFHLGGHMAYYLAKTIEKTKVYLVSTMPDTYVAGTFKLRPSRTVNAALQSAFRALGKTAKVATMPYGSATLPTAS